MKRKILITFSCVLVLGCSLAFFRHQIAAHSAKLFLTKALGKSFSCQKITSSDGRIAMEGFTVTHDRMNLMMENASFSINFKEVVFHPKTLIRLYKEGTSHWSSYLSAMKQYGVNLDAQSGALNLDEKDYYFAFESGDKKHEIGTLKIFLDANQDDYPFLLAQFHMRGDQLISQLRVDEVESERFFHLGAIAFPSHLQGYTGAKGIVQMHASVIFEKDGHIDEISTRFKSSDLSVSIPKMQLQLGLGSLKGELNYPEGLADAGLPMWKQMDCNLKLEDGWVDLGSNFKLSGLTGILGLDPRENPSLTLTGNLESDAKSLAMHLKGKGAIHEDHAYWLEFDLNLNDNQGTLCNAFLSVCRPEANSHIVQLEALGMLPAQIEMLKGYFAKAMPRANEWTVHEGTFGGRLITLFENGALRHFEVQDMKCEKVSLIRDNQPFYFSKITGEGRLFEELNLCFTMPTPHFFGLVSEDLRKAYEGYLPDDFIELSSTLDFSSQGVKTSATVNFPLFNEAIHFGFTAPVAFPSILGEIKRGWARSEKISYELYGPLVRLGDENLKVFGDVDLVGTYDGKVVELSLQVDQFLAKHPLIDFKADRIGEKDQTVGRIRLQCEPQTGAFSAFVPLKQASAYERNFGLVASDLDATLRIQNGKLHGELSKGTISFDQKPLLQQVSGAFICDKEMSIEKMNGTLALNTDKEFILAIDTLSANQCAARLIDGKEEIANLTLKHEKSWEGILKVDQLGKPFNIALNWDIINNFCKLTASNDAIHFSGRKDQASYLIDSFDGLGVSLSGNFTKGDDGFNLNSLSLQKEDFALETSGIFHIDIPRKEAPFGIRSELMLQGEKAGDIPLRFATTAPVYCAFSPTIGWILSDASLSCEDSQVNIEHLEYLFCNEKLSGHNAHFQVTKPLCDRLIYLGLAPSLIGDFRFKKGLQGLAHFQKEKNSTHLTSVLETPVGPLKAELKWKESKGTLLLGDKEQLLFETHLDKNGGLTFDAISGKLGRVEADLKAASKGKLKGKLELDFSLFDEIFDLPLNRYLSIWKTGGGYLFEGVFTPADHFADWTFKGKIKGREFECGGYAIRSMDAKIEIAPGQISIENLDITDDAGKAWVSEGAIMHSGHEWIFSFPLIEIRSFQPSFLRKLGGKDTAITPLVIKSATLEGLRGRIDDPKSVTGNGTLKFTNISKKGESWIPKNLPTSVLRNMGLDGSLFVPASGQMDYVFQEGRCYLRKVAKVVSDKGNSEFSPPRNGVIGYIDFNGKVYLDMFVRQNVVRSISGPISLKVRGNINDPEITIR